MRSFGHGSIVAVGAFTILVWHAPAAGTPPVANAVPAAPNIVLLLADDLSLQVMDYAASATLADGSYLMPNFRRYIRDKAVDFRQAFSSNPVCCPARATILTGQYSHNHGTYTNWIRNGTAVSFRDGSDQTGDGVPDGDTIGFALQRAGYRTAYVGKYLNGYASMLGNLPGPERDAVYQEQVDVFGAAKTRVLLSSVPETGRTYQPPGWTEWYASIDPTTYCMYNTVFSVDGRPMLFHSSGRRLDPDNLPVPLPPGGGANYQTDVIRDLSVRFLDNHRGATDPLFLLISTLAPHIETCDWAAARLSDVGPLSPNTPLPFGPNIDSAEEGGQGYRGLFLQTVRPAVADLPSVGRFKQAAAQLLTGSPSFDEADPSDKPSFIHSKAVPMTLAFADGPAGSPEDRYPYWLSPNLFPNRPSEFNRDLSTTTPRAEAIDQFARMMASLAAVDRLIGAVAQRLESDGRLANTVFVFTSDNGYVHGQHRMSTKLLAYEESIRVPLYVSLPALAQGVRSWGMVLQTDLAPTLLDLAGGAAASVAMRVVPDGTSFKSLLQDPALAWRKQGLIEHFTGAWADEPLGIMEHPSLFAVRTSYHNAAVPIRSYTEYFRGMQYADAPGPMGWPAGFYRVTCRPDRPLELTSCSPASAYKVPVRPYIYTSSGGNADRLPEREYYNLELDPYQLTNGFGAGAPQNISALAAAEAATLQCRLNALVHCAGTACRTAEWAAAC